MSLRMRPVLSLLPLLLCALSCAESAPAPPPASRPNFVFILADDVGWKDVGYAGSAYRTPFIDRLAERGVVFTQAYAAAPSCSPTRASILTGRHPARIGLTKAIRIKDYQDARKPPPPRPRPDLKMLGPPSLTYLPLEETTFAERLREAGYATGFVGKWHLGQPAYHPEKQGFTWTRAVGSFSASPYFPPFQVDDPGDVAPGEYLTDHLTDEAIGFLREHAEEPFLLYVSHFAVHGPWQGKPRDVARLAKELDPDAPQGNPTYGAMIESLDAGVGKLVEALEELGLAENTVVVFTSDNGPTLEKFETYTTTAPLRGGKLDLYEGGIRVPTVVSWPGAIGEAVCDEPIVSMDFYPTFLRLAGLDPAPTPAASALPDGGTIDGLDLSPLLFGSGSLDRDTLYFHVPHRHMSAGIRRGDRKLVHFFGERTELYDLAADPGEAHDLAAADPARAEPLRGELFRWLEEIGAGMPRENPDYDPDYVAPNATEAPDESGF